jgi:site-specific recombinase XerD
MAGGQAMKTRLAGPLADGIKKHLQLRRSLGYLLRTDELTLNQFDAYVAEKFPAAQVVTRPMVVGYLKTLEDRHLVTRRHQLSTLRQFCRFLFQLNPDTYIPESTLLPPARSQFLPHLYTMAEITDLMKLALQLPPADSLRPHTYSTLIGLLWATGLRGGEAVRLNLEDVDLERGILHIRQTKNFQSRLVPLADSTRVALQAYRDLRASFGLDQNLLAPFFVNVRRHRCAHRTVDATFRILTRELGLMSVYGREPRLHDLRHTWATRCLAGLYETGKDPNVELPAVATYLGHVNIACTTIYLHPTTDLLARVGDRFELYVTAPETKGPRRQA